MELTGRTRITDMVGAADILLDNQARSMISRP